MTATRASVLRAMWEYRRIGPDAFFLKYTNGWIARTRFLEYEGVRYPLKALWAAANNPPQPGGSFNSNQAQLRIAKLGFTNAIYSEDDLDFEAVEKTRSRRGRYGSPEEALVAQDIAMEGSRVVREVKLIKRHTWDCGESKTRA